MGGMRHTHVQRVLDLFYHVNATHSCEESHPIVRSRLLDEPPAPRIVATPARPNKNRKPGGPP